MTKISSNLTRGNFVFCDDVEYCISEVLDLESIVARDVNSGRYSKLLIRDLKFESLDGPKFDIDLSIVEDPAWENAVKRYEIIAPLLESQPNLTQATQKVAEQNGVHPATIYRWIKAFKSAQLVSSLLDSDRPGGKEKGRLEEEIESLMMAVIENEYLVKKKSIPGTIEQVKLAFFEAGKKAPHPNTIRTRIKWIDPKRKLKAREGQKAVDQEHGAIEGPFPNADYPLSLIQIDHTELDLIIVDDVYRLPIGRPWITVAIDVCSRVVVGFYVSLEPPSAMSVGLCLSQSILRKDELVEKYKTESKWPAWGLMKVIHADNAKEFRGNMLKRVCEEYQINLEWRPVARPNYGAHIERLLGTFAMRIHDLPGTTFSSVDDKGDYDSEKYSIFTLEDINRWLMYLVVDVYHNDMHDSIQCPPMAKYEEGILGSSTTLGRGLPELPTNEDKLKIDFLPCIERTVQKEGITWDNITYFHDVLRPWINIKDPKTKKKKLFVVRRDPRDISCIYFYDPDNKRYYKIPYKNPAHPSVTLWEWRAAERAVREKGLSKVNESVIFRALIKMRKLEEAASEKTKKARRNSQRRKESKKQLKQPKTEPPKNNVVNIKQASSKPQAKVIIKPFDDLEG